VRSPEVFKGEVSTLAGRAGGGGRAARGGGGAEEARTGAVAPSLDWPGKL